MMFTWHNNNTGVHVYLKCTCFIVSIVFPTSDGKHPQVSAQHAWNSHPLEQHQSVCIILSVIPRGKKGGGKCSTRKQIFIFFGNFSWIECSYFLSFRFAISDIESLSVTSRYHGAKKVSSKQTPKLLPRGSHCLCSKGQNLSIIA